MSDRTCPVCFGTLGRPKDYSGGCRCPHPVRVSPWGGVRRKRKAKPKTRVVLKPMKGDVA